MNHSHQLKLLILSTLALALPACLKARETDRISYDAAKDEFHLVMVLENIDGGSSDLEYLGRILANKDHLIAPVMPGDALGFAPWFLRLDDHKTAKVSFAQPSRGDMQPIDATASLNTISIRPGTLFVQNQRLGYYHAITIPGKTVDALLKQARLDNVNPLKKSVKAELERRSKGGKTYTWQQLINQEVAAVKTNSPDHPIRPFMVMEPASLDKIVAATATGGLIRHGKDFQIFVPLTPTDRAGLAELWDTWTKTVDAHPSDNPLKKDPGTFTLSLPFDAITLAATDGGTLLSIDILKIYNSLSDSFTEFQKSQPLFAPNSSPVSSPSSEVEYATSHDWPVSTSLTTQKILQDFDAGALQSFPSDPLVPPGTGLKVQPKK